MSDDVTVSFDQVVTDNLFSFGPFDVQNTITTTPPPSIKKRQIMFYLLFAPLSIFKSLYRLCASRTAVTSGDVNVLVKCYRGLSINDINGTCRYLLLTKT